MVGSCVRAQRPSTRPCVNCDPAAGTPCLTHNSFERIRTGPAKPSPAILIGSSTIHRRKWNCRTYLPRVNHDLLGAPTGRASRPTHPSITTETQALKHFLLHCEAVHTADGQITAIIEFDGIIDA